MSEKQGLRFKFHASLNGPLWRRVCRRDALKEKTPGLWNHVVRALERYGICSPVRRLQQNKVKFLHPLFHRLLLPVCSVPAAYSKLAGRLPCNIWNCLSAPPPVYAICAADTASMRMKSPIETCKRRRSCPPGPAKRRSRSASLPTREAVSTPPSKAANPHRRVWIPFGNLSRWSISITSAACRYVICNSDQWPEAGSGVGGSFCRTSFWGRHFSGWR